MKPVPDVPIPYRIIAMIQERNRLFTFPLEHLAGKVCETRFRGDCCRRCCTHTVNGHIFLLDHDAAELKDQS